MGAGILPIVRHNNKLYFLFGREYNYKSNNKWSDFGGRAEKMNGSLLLLFVKVPKKQMDFLEVKMNYVN